MSHKFRIDEILWFKNISEGFKIFYFIIYVGKLSYKSFESAGTLNVRNYIMITAQAQIRYFRLFAETYKYCGQKVIL